MKSAPVVLALLLVVPAAAGAQVCDLNGTGTDGAKIGIFAFEVNVVAKTIDAAIVTNGIGPPSSAKIDRGASPFVDLAGLTRVDLNLRGIATYANADLADLVDNPQDYTASVTGPGGTVSTSLQRAIDCEVPEPEPEVDLQLKKITANPNKLKAIVKNLSSSKSTATVVKFYLSTDDIWDKGTDLELAMKALKSVKGNGRKKAKTNNPSPWPDGQFFVIAVVDPDEQTDDPDRTNNYKSTKSALDLN